MLNKEDKIFYDRIKELRIKVKAAIKIRCSRVAKARMREIARLYYEKYGIPEEETIKNLRKRYSPKYWEQLDKQPEKY